MTEPALTLRSRPWLAPSLERRGEQADLVTVGAGAGGGSGRRSPASCSGLACGGGECVAQLGELPAHLVTAGLLPVGLLA